MWEPTAAERNWHCFSPARSHQSPHRYTNGFLHAMEALQPWAAHQWSVLPPVAPVTLPVHNVELGLSSEDETAALLPRGAGGLVGAQRARPQPRGTLNDALIAARGRGPMPRRTASLGGPLASAQPATDGCPPSSASPPLLGSFRVVGGLHGANGPRSAQPIGSGCSQPPRPHSGEPLAAARDPRPCGVGLGSRHPPAPCTASPALTGAPAPADCYPPPAVVLIRGNARTRQSLIGQRAVVRRAVGLGGWHWLVSRVRGRRSCARAGAPPAPCAMRGTLPAAHQFAHPLAWRAAGAAVWRGGQAAAQRARGAGAAHRRRDGEAAGRQGPCRACPSLPAPAALVQACTALWRHAVLQNRFIQPKVLLPQLLCAILALQDMSEEEEERRREQQQSVARGYAYEPAEPHAEGGLERRLIECLSAACWLLCVLPACRWRPT